MKILVVAAHPDDEVLGCGGTIAKHIAKGDSVYVTLMAEGVTSRSEYRESSRHVKELVNLQEAAKTAHRILGTTALQFFDYPDNRMDSVDRIEVTKKVEKLLRKYQPDIIYTHHAGDVNIDHRVIHEAVVTASRPQLGLYVQTLLFFEIASSTEWQTPVSNIPFNPNWFVNISETMDKKLLALEAYASEMRAWPHPRSLEALQYLAQWRGATVGSRSAESFCLGRNIIF